MEWTPPSDAREVSSDWTPPSDAVEVTPSLSPEQIAAHAKQSQKSFSRGEYPGLSKAVDFAAGQTGLIRGLLNTPERAYNAVTGSDASPTFANKMLGDNSLVDKNSWSYLGGSLVDPLAATGAVGATQLASKIIPSAPVIAGAVPKMLPTFRGVGQGMLGGGMMGAGQGAVSDDGTMLGGAATGALFGGALSAVLPTIGGALQKGLGAATDMFRGQSGQVQAGKIARAAAGGNINAIKAAMSNAPQELTAGQAAYGINQDMWQALQEIAKKNDPASYYRVLAEKAAQNDISAMTRAGGQRTQEAAVASNIASKDALNQITTPMREEVLGNVNAVGAARQALNATQGEVSRLENAAAGNVEDVRRFTAAGERAKEMARQALIEKGQPVGASRYTYLGGDIPARAEQVAATSAEASLTAGAAARTAKTRLDQLKLNDVEPLNTDKLTSRLENMLNKPSTGVDKTSRTAITNVSTLIKEWTARNGGVIDAEALYEIRKSGVNNVVQDLMPNADAKSQNKVAAALLKSIRPVLDDAIEAVGGTGWTNYLKTYSEGAHNINQNKLMSKAIQMYENSPDAFMKLVAGNDVKQIEKIFGTGSYSIVKEMGQQKMIPLKSASSTLERTAALKEQAGTGEGALANVIDKIAVKFKLPFGLRPEISPVNKVLEIAERNLSASTKNAIVEGMKSGESAQAMLNKLPLSERNKFLMVLGQLNKLGPYSTMATVQGRNK